MAHPYFAQHPATIAHRLTMRSAFLFSALLLLCITATACAQARPAAPTQPIPQPRPGRATTPNDPNAATVYPGITNISSVITPNPDKGWAIYYWGNAHATLTPNAMQCASIFYLRPDWTDLETDGEGKFNWHLIDDALQVAKSLNKKLAFRVMGTEPSSERENTFPMWVMQGYEEQFEKSTYEIDGYTNHKWYPKDPGHSPRWKYAVQHLVKELGARYDGNPDIAFAEVGTIGDWGEQISNYAKSNQMLDQMAWREHLGWYLEAFKHTPLMSVTAGQHNMEYGWADEHGFGRRSDGFCAPMVVEDTTNGGYQDGRQIDKSYDLKLPSFLECPPGVDPARAGRKFKWGKFWRGILVFGRPTYLAYNVGPAIPNGMDRDYPYRLIESANRLGYHIVATRVSYPLDLFEKTTGKVTFTFRNDGCKFPDYPIYTALAVLDENNNVLQTIWCDSVDLRGNAEPWVSYEWVDDFSGRFLLPAPKTYTATADVTMTPNRHAARLAMGFFSDKTLAQPNIRLGNEGRLPTGWYPLDQYSVIPQADAYPALHNLAFKKTVMASATATGELSALTDGNSATAWSSPAEPNQWASIDLGISTAFSVIMLDWNEKSPAAYTIESSQNGAAWTVLCQVASARAGKDYINVPDTQARFIRVTTQDPAGLSLYDFEILGSEQAERPRRRRP